MTRGLFRMWHPLEPGRRRLFQHPDPWGAACPWSRRRSNSCAAPSPTCGGKLRRSSNREGSSRSGTSSIPTAAKSRPGCNPALCNPTMAPNATMSLKHRTVVGVSDVASEAWAPACRVSGPLAIRSVSSWYRALQQWKPCAPRRQMRLVARNAGDAPMPEPDRCSIACSTRSS